MPAATKDYSRIEELKKTAMARTSAGRGLTASAGTLGDNIMAAVREARTERGVSKLATDVGRATSQLVSRPESIRERTRGIVDPTKVNILTSGARAQSLKTLGEVATQRGLTEATIQETVQAGANRLKAQAQELYAQAEQATAEAEALEGEWKRGQAEQAAALDTWYKQQQVAQGWARINADAGGVGEEEGVLETALSVLGGADINDVSISKGRREKVLNMIASLTKNADITQEVFGVDVYGGIRNFAEEATSKLGYIDEAISYLESGNVSGWGAGNIRSFLSKAGLSSEEMQRAIRNVEYVSSAEMFNIGGKQLPSNEQKTIRNLVIDLKGAQEAGNIETAKKLKTKLKDQYIKLIMEAAKDRNIPLTYDKAKMFMEEEEWE